MNEWCFRLSRYSKFLFRRWLTSMFTSVSFWKIAAMLVQSSTTFRGGAEVCLRWYCALIETLSQGWHYCEFFVSSLTDDIFVLKYSAYIQTSTSPPPLQWPLVLAFLSTRSCDSCEVGENGMEELVWSTMRRMEWWKRHERCEPLLVGNCDCASR